MKNLRWILPAIALGWAAVTASGATNVFLMPRLQDRHVRLTREFRQALQIRDLASMESISRAGTALLPEDPTWRYNLACALALLERNEAALDELEQAIELGFRDLAHMQRDTDLEPLRPLPRFTALMQKARDLKETPATDAARKRATPIRDGVAWVSNSNTVWNYDVGRFATFFSFPTNLPAVTNPVVNLPGPAGNAIRAWFAEGTASGNRGDLYDNRDGGHSRLDLRLFPYMTAVVYDAEARRYGVHHGLSQFLFNGATLGNSSTAMTQGPFWRSNARLALADTRHIAFLALQYYRNHIYFYPEHRDYDADHQGDTFAANTPYLVVSQGSSGSDQPFMQAVAATLAAFRPEVKQTLLQTGLLCPTVQWLLRASQTGVTNRAAYLSGATHPPVFDASRLDPLRMVTMAHDLTTNALPPLVAIRMIEETTPPAGSNLVDHVGVETLFDSPACIARVVRSLTYRRRMVVSAVDSRDMRGRDLTWHWVLLRGDPAKVTIRPLDAAGQRAEIQVDYHGRFPVAPDSALSGSRVDVGVFADNGTHLSAPAFVSLYYLANELRTYAADGRILKVDYAAAADRYTDPMIALPRRWVDIYHYDTALQLTGWTRLWGDQSEHFTRAGARIETTDALGRPVTARSVQYVPRATAGDNRSLPELVQVDGDIRWTYRYDSDADTTGRIVSRVQVAE